MPVWHKTLKDRFFTFPTFQQLIMVANELNRAQNMQDVPLEYKNALERALELIDFISVDKRWRHKLKEIRRAREMIAMYYYNLQSNRDTQILQKCLIQLDSFAWKMMNKNG